MRKLFSILIQLYLFVSCNFLPFGEDRWGCLFSQNPTQEWVARIPGPSNDLIGPFFAVDKNGNSYVLGTHVINDSINILVVKYNTLGVQEWYTLYKYPGEGYFAPTGLALDSSGNAYVISYFAQTYLVPYNGLIVKFNSATGSPVWAKKYVGQYGVSSFQDIKIDRMNNIYVVGTSDTSHLVARYNSDGDSVWVRKYHPPFCSEGARACTIDDSLNIIFTGIRVHSYDTLLVAKYSPVGILRWESTYAQGVSANVGFKITADQNGNAYIGGATTISTTVYLTLKYDRNGARQWASIYIGSGGAQNTIRAIAFDKINSALFVTGGASNNGIQKATTIRYNITNGDSLWVRSDSGTYIRANNSAIVVDSTGNIYTTGGTYILGLSTFDIMTRKYSGQSNPLWMITYNGSYNGNDYGLDLALDNYRNIYVLGTSQSGFQLYDYIILKYNQLVGITNINETANQFSLSQNYPNPFNSSSKFKIQNPKVSNVNITVYDILGRVVENLVNELLKEGVYEINIDGTNYSSGTYFYRMTADGNIIDTKKFILLK